jgi:hypothetical protein
MVNKLTELEKSILMVFFIASKGEKNKYMDENVILLKFPRSQNKIVRRYLDRLVENRMIIINPTKGYALTEDGFERSRKLLSEGVHTFRL